MRIFLSPGLYTEGKKLKNIIKYSQFRRDGIIINIMLINVYEYDDINRSTFHIM